MTETNSTPPAQTGGTEITRFNALKHGVLSRYIVLPWEDADEYRALVVALTVEHAPPGTKPPDSSSSMMVQRRRRGGRPDGHSRSGCAGSTGAILALGDTSLGSVAPSVAAEWWGASDPHRVGSPGPTRTGNSAGNSS
jgi:hypothetical protein